jgi:acetate kinase
LNILALNSGSSSIKFGAYVAEASRIDKRLSGEIESGGGESAAREAIAQISKRLAGAGLPAPDAVGHRIVHGGPKLLRHCVIDDAVLRELEAAVAFAPLHAPAALAIIRLAQEHFPAAAQVACFDTAFHAGLPDVARVLPLPKELRSEGIHRYGFHGLSCESIVHQLADKLPQRLVIAHLGNGASVTAVKSGKSIDTSMGLTPTGGVIMGTRSGDLDPGVLVYLMREMNLDATMLEDLIDRRSGLLGISGVSGDMRRLHEAASSSADARLAIQMFCQSVRKQIAAMIAVLEGIDLLVFTGGIGENDAEVRAAICNGLAWAAPAVRVLASQEDEQIARHIRGLLPS